MHRRNAVFFFEAPALRGAEICDGFRPRQFFDSFCPEFVSVFLGILAAPFVFFGRASPVRSTRLQLLLWAKREPLTALPAALHRQFPPRQILRTQNPKPARSCLAESYWRLLVVAGRKSFQYRVIKIESLTISEFGNTQMPGPGQTCD